MLNMIEKRPVPAIIGTGLFWLDSHILFEFAEFNFDLSYLSWSAYLCLINVSLCIWHMHLGIMRIRQGLFHAAQQVISCRHRT